MFIKRVLSNLILKRFLANEAKFPTTSFKLHKLEAPPPSEITLKKDEAVELLTQMKTIRRMETVCGDLYKKKIVRGFCHLYIGEEAVAVGIKSEMKETDSVITSYRAHGWVYLMGAPISSIFGELMGNVNGCSKGKGGSMHMYTDRFYGGNGIVGASVPLGVGIALAAKYRNEDSVCIIGYGDGAANQGQVFEAFNIAKLLKLPALFLCENNLYAMGTSVNRHSSNDQYYTRGDYIPGLFVNGMDIISIKAATRFALDYVRKNGPLVLECKTYRYVGHSMSDPGTSYRSREEVADVRKNQDCIMLFKNLLINANLVGAEEEKKMKGDIRKTVEEALAKAQKGAELPLEELTADICVDYKDDLRGIDPWKSWKHKRISKPINLP